MPWFRNPVLTLMAIGGLNCLSISTAAELVPGFPIERDLAGGETHAYEVSLAAGQYLDVVADKRGIDSQLPVFAPDGKALISIDKVSGLAGLGAVSVVAAAGAHIGWKSAQSTMQQSKADTRSGSMN